MLYIVIMGAAYAIPRGQTPPYPTDEDAKLCALRYLQDTLPYGDPYESYWLTAWNDYFNVKVTGGINGFFFVYAWPPEGFVVADPEDIIAVQTIEAWILQRINDTDKFNTIVKLSRDGSKTFWSIRLALPP